MINLNMKSGTIKYRIKREENPRDLGYSYKSAENTNT